MVESTYKLRPDNPLLWCSPRFLGKKILAPETPRPGGGLGFLYIPPVASKGPIDEWDIPPLSFQTFGYAVCHSDNVLAVGELTER